MTGGHRLALATGQLGIPADGRQWRPQLVRGVGDELAHPLLALVAGLERPLDVVEHVVEGEPDLAHLGARVGVGRGDAFGEGDVAGVQLEVGDVRRGVRHPLQGREVAAHQPEPAGRHEDEPDDGAADDEGDRPC